MTFNEINFELQKAQAEYEAKASELIQAQKIKEDAEVALIRADSTHRSLRLQVTVLKSRIDSLKECSWNLRKEASL